MVLRRISIEGLYAALELLTEKEKDLINALFFDDMTEREVARALGFPSRLSINRKIKYSKS